MSDDVSFERCGGVGIATLRRPAALNALTLAMVRTLDAQLRRWRADPQIVAVVLRGAPHPSRGPVFCAGADIRFFHGAALAGDPALDDFLTEEFRLDHLVWTFGKPVIALLDGVVMGGGLGLVQGARLRVVTERTAMAMPETGIGFFPDVGAGYFLSRCPGRLGEYLAMTGRTIDAGDALAAGLADVMVEGDTLAGLVEALRERPLDDADQVLAAVRAHGQAQPRTQRETHAQTHAQAHVQTHVQTDLQADLQTHSHAPIGASTLPRAAIDAHFAEPDVPSIVQGLRADGSRWALETLDLLRTRSPTMVAVALQLVRRGRHLSLADDFRMELGMARHAFAPGQGEAVEGIRALAIDKDRAPRWSPDTHDAVDPRYVDAYFEDRWDAGAHPLRDL